MAEVGSIVAGLFPQGSTIGLMLLIGAFMVVVFGLVGVFSFFMYNKRRWNLKVEIKLPRSDGTIINGEWAKGFFHSKRGVVYIKRGGLFAKKIALKIFDPKRYLQGENLLTVVQLSPVDYRPVLPKSFLEYEVEYLDEKTGETHTVKEAILSIKCDTGHSKAWEQAFEAASRQAYSLKSFMQQFQTPIAIAIVLVAVFVGIAALWTQLPS